MRRLRGLRWWHGAVSVITAAGVGVLTNLATDEFAWVVAAALAVLVATQVALSTWQAAQDRADARTARDALLGPLRPTPPEADGGGRAVAHWLTAPFSPTPLWGRGGVHARLLDWCVRRGPGVVRVVTGPAGVGKSRLALAVAESLPPGWAAGRLQGAGDGLVERIVAAGDPTLVVVDDADRVPAGTLETLVGTATRHPDLVRVLLLSRTAEALPDLPEALLPELRRGEALAPVGEAGDRQRWYAQAVRAYATALRVAPPDVPDRPVGSDDDTPLVLHARALLAVLGRTRTRTWSPAELVTELVALEQRGWRADLPELPRGCDVEVLAEAVTVLLLLPADDLDHAARLLRRVPQFAHDAAQESRVAVARWALRRYPPGPDHRLDLRPHLVAERLVLNTLSRAPRLLTDDDMPVAAPILVAAHTDHADALDVLSALLAPRPAVLPETITAILSTGAGDHRLDRALAALVDSEAVAIHPDARERLVALVPHPAMTHLFVAHGRLLVDHHRRRAEDGGHRPELAQSLAYLAHHLRDLGRYAEALAPAAEAVEIRRELADLEPDQHLPELARSLYGLATTLSELGRDREALAADERALRIRRDLTHADPAGRRADLARSLSGTGMTLLRLGRLGDALAAHEEAVEIRRDLARADPAERRADLADSLHSLGVVLWQLGRYREALAAVEEATAARRDLASAAPGLPERVDLGDSYHMLGAVLVDLRRAHDALALLEAAVEIRRELARVEPGAHRRDLAESLNAVGATLLELGRAPEALGPVEAAVTIHRDLAEAEQAGHRPALAFSLYYLGEVLHALGQPESALASAEESVAHLRDLVETEPGAHRSDLARYLGGLALRYDAAGSHREAVATIEEAIAHLREPAHEATTRDRRLLGGLLTALGHLLTNRADVEGALQAYREAVDVWRSCAEQDPELDGPSHRQALTLLRHRLHDFGRLEEAAAIELDGSG
ncbi:MULTISPECIES: tetratricopeptide repeat protein [unclassified Saccharothrix]|uniref:tetratricopeptide repeat protein n=1 Tax=unclassified Saccharothrix TaxID=2593673 RepID=UPI00307EF7E3